MVGESSQTLVIVGAGGFGREVLDIVEAINETRRTDRYWRVVGFADDQISDSTSVQERGFRVVSKVEASSRFSETYVIAVGDGRAREQIDLLLSANDMVAASLFHPSSTRGSINKIEDGFVMAAGSRVTTNVHVGRHVHLNLNSTIGHDCYIGDYSTIHPGATVSGAVSIGRRVTIGTGANVLPGVEIGDDVYVGAGAVVTKNIPSGLTVVGAPARPIAK